MIVRILTGLILLLGAQRGGYAVLSPTPVAGGISIAFDNASTVQSATASSLTYSFTTGSGTNRMLLVGVSTTTTVTTPTVTYNGSSMTSIKNVAWFFGGGDVTLFCIVAPSTGANNVVITFGVSNLIESVAMSYTGVNQSCTPDASTSTTGGPATSTTLTLTTVANNCWTFSVGRGASGTTITAGAGATLRTGTGQVIGGLDSNAPITPAGSTSQTINFGSSVQFGAVMVSFTHA